MLFPLVSKDDLVQARLEREMVILEKLAHPHIVEYYRGGREAMQLFSQWKLVTGSS